MQENIFDKKEERLKRYKSMNDSELLKELLRCILEFEPNEMHKDTALAIDYFLDLEESIQSLMMKKSRLDMLVEFQKAFKSNIGKEQFKVSDGEKELRINLISEELEELKEAIAVSDKIEILDALCDLEYVLLGTIVSFGFHHVFEDAFREVHRSNMSKLLEAKTIGDAHQFGIDFDDKYGKGNWDYRLSGKPNCLMAIRLSDGKILKPSGYSSPDLVPFID